VYNFKTKDKSKKLRNEVSKSRFGGDKSVKKRRAESVKRNA